MTSLSRSEPRRSTRVPIRVQIELHGTEVSCEGETIIVNLHGALVRTSAPLQLGDRITLRVQLTGKSATARVVLASREAPMEFGIGFDKPQNVWGISLPPADWREESA